MSDVSNNWIDQWQSGGWSVEQLEPPTGCISVVTLVVTHCALQVFFSSIVVHRLLYIVYCNQLLHIVHQLLHKSRHADWSSSLLHHCANTDSITRSLSPCLWFSFVSSRNEKQHVLATLGMDHQKSSHVRWMESIRGRILWTPLLRLSRQYYAASSRRDRQKRTEIWEFLLTIHRMPTSATFHKSMIDNITFHFIIISYNNNLFCSTNPLLIISSSVSIIFKL